MNFTSYLSVSLATHLLLAGFLYLVKPPLGTTPPVFNVNIVVPPEIRERIIPEQTQPPVAETKPLPPKGRPKLPEKELPPERLRGEGTGAPEKDHDPPKSPEPPVTAKDTPASVMSREDTAPLQPGTDNPAIAPLSSLFDKSTIEKYVRKNSPEKKGLSFDTSEFRHRGYMKMLKDRIENIWKYPEQAARQQISGDLYMKFLINRDGSLEDVELLRTSGYRELDEAAMKAVKNAGPFWPLPADWEEDTLEVKGHFIYIFGNTLVL